MKRIPGFSAEITAAADTTIHIGSLQFESAQRSVVVPQFVECATNVYGWCRHGGGGRTRCAIAAIFACA